jgi:hypothetical protein
VKAISIRQPWAHYIITGKKPVENRIWHTSYRGSLLIHASKKFDSEGYYWIGRNHERLNIKLPMPHPETFYCGGVIGIAILQRLCRQHPSPWFCGPWGWVFDKTWEFDTPVAYKGQLGIFEIHTDLDWLTETTGLHKEGKLHETPS